MLKSSSKGTFKKGGETFLPEGKNSAHWEKQMIGTLYKEGFPSQNVQVEFPERNDFSPNDEFEVTIIGDEDQSVRVFPEYKFRVEEFESLINLLGANIIEPEIEPAGQRLQVGKSLTIRLTHDC